MTEFQYRDFGPMDELALSDLEAAADSMYVAAKRFVAVREAEFTHSGDDETPINIGLSAGRLARAASRYDEAYARWDKTMQGGEKPEDDGGPQAEQD